MFVECHLSTGRQSRNQFLWWKFSCWSPKSFVVMSPLASSLPCRLWIRATSARTRFARKIFLSCPRLSYRTMADRTTSFRQSGSEERMA